jgi:hypothetical protein
VPFPCLEPLRFLHHLHLPKYLLFVGNKVIQHPDSVLPSAVLDNCLVHEPAHRFEKLNLVLRSFFCKLLRRLAVHDEVCECLVLPSEKGQAVLERLSASGRAAVDHEVQQGYLRQQRI